MSPRPFPYPLRVGTDICNVIRIKKLISRRSTNKPSRALSRFIIRLLTSPERKYFWARFGSPKQVFTKLDAASQFLAGRFAAKEACRKACEHFDKNARGFQQIVILPLNHPGGSEHPSPRPHGLILDEVYKDSEETTGFKEQESNETEAIRKTVDWRELEGQLCEISISHDGDFATAVAIVPVMGNI